MLATARHAGRCTSMVGDETAALALVAWILHFWRQATGGFMTHHHQRTTLPSTPCRLDRRRSHRLVGRCSPLARARQQHRAPPPGPTVRAAAANAAPTVQALGTRAAPITATVTAAAPVRVTNARVTSNDANITLQNTGTQPVDLSGRSLMVGTARAQLPSGFDLQAARALRYTLPRAPIVTLTCTWARMRRRSSVSCAPA